MRSKTTEQEKRMWRACARRERKRKTDGMRLPERIREWITETRWNVSKGVICNFLNFKYDDVHKVTRDWERVCEEEGQNVYFKTLARLRNKSFNDLSFKHVHEHCSGSEIRQEWTGMAAAREMSTCFYWLGCWICRTWKVPKSSRDEEQTIKNKLSDIPELSPLMTTNRPISMHLQHF